MQKYSFKKIVGKIHLWLGLASGLVVFIVSLTGCIYVFQEEISRALNTNVWVEVEPQNQPYASVETYINKVKEQYTGELNRITFDIFYSQNDAVVSWVEDLDDNNKAFILNPYTGEVIKSFEYSVTFWAFVRSMHVSLLIPGIGDDIVAASTLIFLISLISGLVLWWPRNKKVAKKRVSFKWQKRTGMKRKNYDLHNILGFYSIFALIFITVSGLTMAYDWMDQAVMWTVNGGSVNNQEEITEPTLSESLQNKQQEEYSLGVDETLKSIRESYNGFKHFFIIFPESTDTVYVMAEPTEDSFYNRTDIYKLERSSGRIAGYELWESKNNGEIYQGMELDIHVGSVLGLPGKILAFVVSLIAATLPITGFYIWWGRRPKKSKRKPVKKNQRSRKPNKVAASVS
ncbi:PepSY-associated TM helix domain-containing protein [Rhodohalobacter sp. 614A]|uniref:PepSY-associated TM helix domain-containing protein n=1 Tax=Rhodohalobacter sp. 614A TaxID=2908649 RepID=UPI001F1C6992|nr:PepSY-associated TM helix domain-containing protein [Rhodohalobacter sp. 614A]